MTKATKGITIETIHTIDATSGVEPSLIKMDNPYRSIRRLCEEMGICRATLYRAIKASTSQSITVPSAIYRIILLTYKR